MSDAPSLRTSQLVALGAGALKRKATFRVYPKKFTVAVDGSRLGFRAVKLAAWLMDEGTRDKVTCVCLTKDITRQEALSLCKEAEDMLKEAGVPRQCIAPCQVIDIPTDSTIAANLAKAASGSILVMGSGGKRLQSEWDRDHVKAKAASGSVANACMNDCAAPVILAKPVGVPSLDGPKFYEKRQHGDPMTIVLPVDGSQMSQKSFDMAARLVKPGDVVKVLHVSNSDKQMLRPNGEANAMLGETALVQYYKGECAKASSRFQAAFEFCQTPIQSSSISTTILKFEDAIQADMIIMASNEMAKDSATGAGTLGSVASTVAKKTFAHMLIAKSFAK